MIKFDENNVVLQFPVISDLHITGKGQRTSKKLENAYQVIKKIGTPDLILYAGDMTDFGLKEQIEEFKEITTKNIDLNKTRLFFAIGNHELYNNEIMGAPLTIGEDFRSVFGSFAYHDATESEIKAMNYRLVISGYHFITINAYKYSGGVDFRDEDVDWLIEKLDEAISYDSEKPIFICAHPMISGTNYGSNYGEYWAGSRLYNVLKNYPQVIYFAGHLHFPLQNELTIWQKEFTTVGTSSVYFSSLEDKNMNSVPYNDIVVGSETVDCFDFSQGLYVKVDKNGTTQIERIDFLRDGEKIKQPWVLPHPDKQKSQLNIYTKEKFIDGKKPPFFDEKASIKETKKDITSSIPTYELEFSAAKDSDMVMGYEITFKNAKTDEILKTTAVYSDFYNSPQSENMSKTIKKSFTPSKMLPFKPFYEEDYYIEIKAYDCFGLFSESIKSEIIKGEKIEHADEILNIPANTKFKVFLDFKEFEKGDKLKYNEDYFCWPPLERGDSATPHLITERSGNKAVTPTIKAKSYQFYCYPRKYKANENHKYLGATQVWLWVDFTQVVFPRLYFALFNNDIEYSTDDRNGCDMKAYIKNNGTWESILFNYDGCLENFGNYRGYIRFSVDYLYNSGKNEIIPLDNVEGFKIGFNFNDDDECKDREFSVTDIKFSK